MLKTILAGPRCLLLAMLLGAGCGGAGALEETRSTSRDEPRASSPEVPAGCWPDDHKVDVMFPTTTLSDWVHYVDHFSVVTVTDEHSMVPIWSPSPETPRDGFVGRKVDVRIDDTVWRREGAPEAPSSFAFVNDARHLDGTPYTVGEGPRLEVGHTYLMGLILTQIDGWVDYPRTTLLFGSDRRLQPNPCSRRETLRQIAGLTPEEVRDLLDQTAQNSGGPSVERCVFENIC